MDIYGILKAKAIGNTSGLSHYDALIASRFIGGGTLIGTDSEPYLYRISPSLGDYKTERDEIVGVSVGFNQLCKNGNFADTTGWDARNGTVSVSGNVASVTVSSTGTERGLKVSDNSAYQFTAVVGHKYLIRAEINAPITGEVLCAFSGVNGVRVPVVSNTWTDCQAIYTPTNTTGQVTLYIRQSLSQGEVVQYKNVECFDLTALFGSTIADYIYSLEQGTAGSGVAFFRKYFGADYYPYDSGSIRSVEGLVSHTMKDENDNIIGEYPLDSTVTLRGLLKLEDGKLKADGDVYKASGKVVRNFGTRAYQSGDESLADAITDGTTTVYKLTTPTTEQAQPFAKNQKVSPSGTEEYVTTSVVPVGHNTEYYG